jgi:hypothetical protein
MLNIRTPALLVIVFSIVSLNSFAAQDCTSQIIGDDYYNLDDNISLLKQEKVILAEFSERLIGYWQGELEQIECKGSIKKPMKVIDSSYAKLEIKEHTIDHLKMKADLDFRNQNKKTFYLRPFFERRYIQSYTFNGPDILILTEKSYQHSWQHGGNVLIETIYKIIISDETLQLDIITYSNGFFSTEERWSLTRW